MKSIIIEGSHRPDGHTTIIADRLAELLHAEVVNLYDKQIGHYEYDHKNQSDDFVPLMKHIATHDLIVFATPVYWYAMSGRLKVFLDRITDCLQIEKTIGRSLVGKSIAALSCGSDENVPNGFFEPFSLTAEYLDMNYKGGVHTWIGDGTISSEIQKVIKTFAHQLK